jgi:hypothetical protein
MKIFKVFIELLCNKSVIIGQDLHNCIHNYNNLELNQNYR